MYQIFTYSNVNDSSNLYLVFAPPQLLLKSSFIFSASHYDCMKVPCCIYHVFCHAVGFVRGEASECLKRTVRIKGDGVELECWQSRSQLKFDRFYMWPFFVVSLAGIFYNVGSSFGGVSWYMLV